ncbi:MAG: nucleotide sugar dehydrogenase [Bacteroidetes bacterium]|nr:MAG: nucleotide sugar dehydrogenase [Bacteroidota bacterium]
MYKRLLNKETKLSLIGLGYVGLPIALEFAKHISVIGFDVSEERVAMMKKNQDPSEELSSEDFENRDIQFTTNPEDLKDAAFHIVAVPTPIDSHNMPDLSPLIKASEAVGKILKKGDYVVYESTVYPGATEEDCIPVLEKFSGLKFIKDFKVGYSPERINPGDKVNTLTTVVKIVSGCDDVSLDNVAKTYELVVKAGVHRAPTMKVAEAAKVIENTQRDVNIALMNELSIIFNRMGINTFDVLEAAGTKWNFLHFYPGLVGGHCIGVDPYYLAYKAQEFRYHPQIISSGRNVNDSMGFYIAKELVKNLIAKGEKILNSKVLVLGVTFKENVSDLRNSKVVDLINELKDYGVTVEVADAYASSDEVKKYYGFGLVNDISDDYNAVVVAVSHNEYLDYDEAFFKSITTNNGILVDVKGLFKDKIKELSYWSL